MDHWLEGEGLTRLRLDRGGGRQHATSRNSTTTGMSADDSRGFLSPLLIHEFVTRREVGLPVRLDGKALHVQAEELPRSGYARRGDRDRPMAPARSEQGYETLPQ